MIRNRVCKYRVEILIFLLFSFAGWLMETVTVSLDAGELVDRGFLHLPVCPIYGACIVAIHALIGKPETGGILLSGVKKKHTRYALYTLLAVLIPVTAELITGVTCEKLFGIRLWDYRWHRFDFMGYISLEMAITWGVAVWALMCLVYPRLEKWVGRIPKKTAEAVATVCVIALAADFLICIGGI